MAHITATAVGDDGAALRREIELVRREIESLAALRRDIESLGSEQAEATAYAISVSNRLSKVENCVAVLAPFPEAK